jgi:hypothetical protein
LPLVLYVLDQSSRTRSGVKNSNAGELVLESGLAVAFEFVTDSVADICIGSDDALVFGNIIVSGVKIMS